MASGCGLPFTYILLICPSCSEVCLCCYGGPIPSAACRSVFLAQALDPTPQGVKYTPAHMTGLWRLEQVQVLQEIYRAGA